MTGMREREELNGMGFCSNSTDLAVSKLGPKPGTARNIQYDPGHISGPPWVLVSSSIPQQG